ncbi:MAG TPA: carbohydrate ABC transporter permease [Firmicutes bacterium]|uniref:Carbohydrate ABC transporter permease n=1 Tax=Capillibacterium thermochitinicola TaxID=2699427 RepID=A0A8J6HZ46_9FIRM|nr:carbohydrate ABC transporter permease [Capillibacterium thermochitinicola]HHW13029.1 carbohydrate ABC transporter permease [Bacillota bacterium]
MARVKFRKASFGERFFRVTNYVVLLIFAVAVILPFWYITVISLNEGIDFARGGVYLWPRAFTWDNYRAVFSELSILRYFRNSILRLGILTPLHLLVTTMAGWVISRRNLPGRKFFVSMFVVAMFVNAGLIPFYLTLVELKLINRFAVYVLPWLFSCFELMVYLVAVRAIPESLIETAYLDGANDFLIYFKIVVPLTAATIATLGLFNAVWAWGDWFTGTFYIRSHEKWTIATYLQMVLQRGASHSVRSAAEAMLAADRTTRITFNEASLRAATLLVTILPITVIYPFLQKYFIHGVMVGSLKE